jgi:IS30 family transposase
MGTRGRGWRWSTRAQRAEIRRRVAAGERILDVAIAVGRSKRSVQALVSPFGGIQPRAAVRSPWRLSAAEREEISRGLSSGASLRRIAAGLGRSPSTVSREVAVNGGRRRYRAHRAEDRAVRQARRPRAAKLARQPRLRQAVERLLRDLWSPQQIAWQLRHDHPHDPEMWVSHETIYQSLFVQGRGALRAELHRCLRSGRARRRPAGRARSFGDIRDMVLLSERPAEIEDRAVPGHWEGDLIIGKGARSAIGTLVERQTRFVMLVALPDGRTAEAVRTALVRTIGRLPEQLRGSLTWDRGKEMSEHARFTVDTGIQVYFCDPHSPWQRGSNENTNGLLRQYFPKGSDLSVHSQADLDAVASALNRRPRQTLGWMTPSQALAKVVALTD